MIALTLNPSTAQVAISDYALGATANAVRKQVEQVAIVDTSATGPARFREVCLEALKSALNDAREDGWSACGGQTVSASTFTHTIRFLEHLPVGTPLPEIAIDPDGDVAIDWSPERDRVVSIRISGDGTVYYAGLDREARFHGREPLREGIPSPVWQAIERVL